MPAHNYLIRYKDGSKRHVDRQERDSLELRRVLKRTGPFSYQCTLEPIRLHSFAALATLNEVEEALLRRYLEQLTVEWALRDERETQREETPEALSIRMEEMGAVGQGELCAA